MTPDAFWFTNEGIARIVRDCEYVQSQLRVLERRRVRGNPFYGPQQWARIWAVNLWILDRYGAGFSRLGNPQHRRAGDGMLVHPSAEDERAAGMPEDVYTTLYFPREHPRKGEQRYQWTWVEPDAIREGYKVEGADWWKTRESK